MRKAHNELPEDNAAMWTELEKRADRIEALEAALKEAGEMWIRKDNRIEQLEAALRDIQRYSVGDPRPRHTWYYDRADAALAPE